MGELSFMFIFVYLYPPAFNFLLLSFSAEMYYHLLIDWLINWKICPSFKAIPIQIWSTVGFRQVKNGEMHLNCSQPHVWDWEWFHGGWSGSYAWCLEPGVCNYRVFPHISSYGSRTICRHSHAKKHKQTHAIPEHTPPLPLSCLCVRVRVSVRERERVSEYVREKARERQRERESLCAFLCQALLWQKLSGSHLAGGKKEDIFRVPSVGVPVPTPRVSEVYWRSILNYSPAPCAWQHVRLSPHT